MAMLHPENLEDREECLMEEIKEEIRFLLAIYTTKRIGYLIGLNRIIISELVYLK